MKQILFQWGPFSLPSYGFFVGMAFVIVMYLSERRGNEIGIPRPVMLDFLFIVSVGAIIGSSLLNFIFSGEAIRIARVSHEGRSFFAGMSGGSIVGLLYLKIRNIPILPIGDIIFLNLPLGHSIGRIGCWFYGCCYGKICPQIFPFGVQFPRYDDFNGEIAGSRAFKKHLSLGLIDKNEQWSLTVYPTQLFAISYLLILFIILRILYAKPSIRMRPGCIIFIYCLLNGIFRFLEEIFRVNVRYWRLLTNAQIVSIVIVMIGIIGLIIVLRKPQQ